MSIVTNSPSHTELEEIMGSAMPVWNNIIKYIETTYTPLTRTWKPSKTDFDRMCLLQHKKRTLAYLTPGKEHIWVAIVLGERAFHLAMGSQLPDEIKRSFLEAKPYAEGRGIRFQVSSLNDLASIATLLKVKTPPT